ncbi:hypothetical protein CMUS01_05809 [Colletotrichum musicola]|uniref:HET domain-containing protein n=1 Tax=Colletotrichum musicola TaxID=2175873 RepID=A0A8H6KQS7_9PEZI|nr:hypothetical protein CMUS01_05809 [Colletotrichum musicola]
MKSCGVSLPGWQADDDGGWGPPRLVTKEMDNTGWCPRSQKVLKGQLGRNATLLFAAVRANIANESRVANESNIHGKHSEICTEEKCAYIQAAKSTDAESYEPEHHPTCSATGSLPEETTCYPIGPDLGEICEILRLNRPEDRLGPFPLLKITGPMDKPTIEVCKWTENTRFATISHVWAQGLGNKVRNEIWSCQLEEIRLYVRNVFGSDQDEFFWLDTLAIPQNPADQTTCQLKATAINLIYHVFREATHCIIIDRHLINTGTSLKLGEEHGIANHNASEDLERREDLMAQFWRLVSGNTREDKTPDNRSIPSGIIFLPGSRLSTPGFGWAPVTWMSHQEESYPYPLSTPKYPTMLREEGLVVHYPGFVLHASMEGLQRLVGRRSGSMVPFDLVVNRGLHEWYKVTDADERGHVGNFVDSREKRAQDRVDDNLTQRLKNDPKSLRFGIILSRPRPVEFPGEIGVLVELWEPENQGKEDEETFYCRIIRRVLVSQLPHGAVSISRNGSPSQHDHLGGRVLKKYVDFGGANIIGVAVTDDQAWCVDGYDIVRRPGAGGSERQHSQPPDPSIRNSVGEVLSMLV